jgi:hypothetical protein
MTREELKNHQPFVDQLEELALSEMESVAF